MKNPPLDDDSSVTHFANVGGAMDSRGEGAHLVVIEGDSVGLQLELSFPEAFVGRSPECHLLLNSKAVSKRHLLVRRHCDQFFLEDLGSTNGTSVNGQMLRPGAARALIHGDTIVLGDQALLFRQTFALTDKASGHSTVNLDFDEIRREVDDLLKGSGLDAGA